MTVLLGLPGTFRLWPRLREQPQRIADMELPPTFPSMYTLSTFTPSWVNLTWSPGTEGAAPSEFRLGGAQNKS
jgi:hypothetical protein